MSKTIHDFNIKEERNLSMLMDFYELTIFDPVFIWKKKRVTNFYAKKLQVPIFLNGECVYELPTIEEIRTYCRDQVNKTWQEVRRFSNPHKYYVDLSQELWLVKQELIRKYKNAEELNL